MGSPPPHDRGRAACGAGGRGSVSLWLRLGQPTWAVKPGLYENDHRPEMIYAKDCSFELRANVATRDSAWQAFSLQNRAKRARRDASRALAESWSSKTNRPCARR